MAKTTPKTKETKPAKLNYAVSLIVNGKKFESKGSTLEEALTNIKISDVARAKVVLCASNGKEKKERVMLPFTINKLTSLSPSMKQTAVKQIAILFNI